MNAQKNKRSKHPNLIYVFADQWRKQAMGFMNEDQVLTPNIDSFAKESIVVDNAVSVCPLCSPHRASLLTGDYPFSTGVFTNCKTGLDIALEPTVNGFGNVLRNKGYQTGYIGKWHLDRSERNDGESPLSGAQGWDAYTPPGPKRQGFDFWYSYGADDSHLHPHYWKDNPTQIKINQWSVSHETDVAIDFIRERQKERPFALFISYNPPHSPYDQVPSGYKALYDSEKIELRQNVQTDFLKPHTHPNHRTDERQVRETTADYFAAVSGVDAEFGRLLDEIQALGLEEETLIVLSADHGDMMASHGLMAKHVWYEESIGIPFLVRWSGHLKADRRDSVIGSPDQMPTILGLMGIDSPSEIEGKDKSGQLLGQEKVSDDFTVIGCYPGQPDAIRRYRERGLDHMAFGWRGIRSKTETFVIHRGYHPDDETQIMLYDLVNDPYQESPRIIDDTGDLSVRRHMARLEEWLKQTGDPFDTRVEQNFDEIVDHRILPHIQSLCEMYYDQRDRMVLDGVGCFEKGQDKDFVYGTLISSFCQVLASMDRESDQFTRWLAMTGEIIAEHIVKPLNTFGILEFLSGLMELKQLGLYEQVINSDTDRQIRERLHWNAFIDPLSLTFTVPRATNYYGVGIRIALLREMLEFDDIAYSNHLLERFFEKVPVNGDGSIYMDETDGQGRYDKYSLSIASELSELYIKFNKPIPEKIRHMLLQSIDIHMMIGDEQGNGCLYGRSIGGNATGTILEVMPLALCLDEMENKELIHSLTVYAGRRMVDFWFDSKRSLFNLWDDGRQTDRYRGKHRILEVNLDLSLKMIRANEFLKKSGWNQVPPLGMKVLKEKLSDLPKVRYIPFESGVYDRGLAVYRGDSGVMMLPMISGGKNYYRNSQYMPIPYSYGLLAGSSDRVESSLIPKLHFEDGTVASPIVYSKEVVVTNHDDDMVVTYRQDDLCVTNDETPRTLAGVSDEITYRISDTVIEREDRLIFNSDLVPQRISMAVDSFSSEAKVNGNSVCFGMGKMKQLDFEGLKLNEITDVSDNGSFHSQYGRLNTQLILSTDETISGHTYTVKTTIRLADKP